MARISVVIPASLLIKLRENAHSKGQSVSQHARELIDIGLQVQETAAKNAAGENKKINEIDALGEVKILWQNILESSAEIKLLARYLTINLIKNLRDEEELRSKLLEFRSSAKTFTQGLLREGI